MNSKMSPPKSYSALSEEEYEMDGGKVDWDVVGPIILGCASLALIAGGTIGAKIWKRKNSTVFIDTDGVTTMIAPDKVPMGFGLATAVGVHGSIAAVIWGIVTIVKRN